MQYLHDRKYLEKLLVLNAGQRRPQGMTKLISKASITQQGRVIVPRNRKDRTDLPRFLVCI